MIDLSVITVTYNSEGLIKKYLTSLKKYLPEKSEIIIVDSGSTDQTISILKNEKGIKLVDVGKNIGFGAGNNLGVKASQGEYLLFLNPDTEVLNDALNILAYYIKTNPNIGIVAPAIVDDSGKIQASVRNLPTILRALKEYYLGIKNSYSDYIPSGDSPVEVEAVYGAAVLISRKIFDKIGGFDKKFFMYFEDLDLCRKVRDLGLKVIYIPEAKIRHKVGASASGLKEMWLKQSARAYHGTLKAFLLYIILRLRPNP